MRHYERNERGVAIEVVGSACVQDATASGGVHLPRHGGTSWTCTYCCFCTAQGPNHLWCCNVPLFGSVGCPHADSVSGQPNLQQHV